MARGISWVFVLTVCAASELVWGQSLSPLQQVMSSNSLIDRPIVFRDLQTDIDSTYKDVKPGARLQLIYDEMSDVRQKILAVIDTPTADLIGDTLIIKYGVYQKRDEIHLLDNYSFYTINGLLDTLEDKLSKRIRGLIISLPPKDPLQKKAVLASVVKMLGETGLVSSDRVSGSTDDGQRIANILGKLLRTKIEEEIKNRFPSLTLDSNISKDVVDKFNSCTEITVSSIREKVADVLDQAESGVTSAINEFSKWLISGNSGIAVTKGEGAFAGGLQLSYMVSQIFQAGIYINAAFNQGGSAKISESLIGMRTQLAFERTAVDLLVSGLFQDANFKGFSSGEFGIGISYRFSDGFIAGVADYTFCGNGFLPEQVVGAMLKGTGNSSPGILIGAKIEAVDGSKNNVNPIFQISFSIFSTK